MSDTTEVVAVAAPTETTPSTTSTAAAAASDDTKPTEADVPPNHTLYAQNLNEKIKLEELKKSLYHVFSQYGNILEIFANKRLKNKGQAWIVFDDLTGATKALREMKNFSFYGKPMRVSYAKAKSDIVAKIDGSFQPRPKRVVEDAKKSKGKKNKDRTTNGTSGGSGSNESKKKRARTDDGNTNGTGSGETKESKVGDYANIDRHEPPSPPNKILFVENLPAQCTSMMLTMLFDKYPGYVEARMVPGKPGIAFVEFHDHYQSGQAKDGLQGFRINSTNAMKITFAK